MKVLIAEDELVTRTVMARAIAHEGHEVATCPDGREMLRLFQETSPDVILVDWQMPVLNGIDAIRELRQLPGGERAFIILVTGINGEGETAQALDAGIDDYVLKPISAPRLRIVLKLSEFRIRHRNALASNRGSGPTPLETLTCLGPVITLDADRIVRSAPPAVAAPPGTEASDLFEGADRAAFERACDEAVSSQGLAEFEATMRGIPSRRLGLRSVYRRDALVGFVLSERDRFATGLDDTPTAANG